MNYDLIERFREKLDNFTISDYHGLSSPGLTCYLNCVLQVLFMTEDFWEAMKQCCTDDSSTIDRHLGELFSTLQKSRGKTHRIVRKLGITNVYEQHDAAEYLEKILCLTSPEAAKMFKGELNHKTTCISCEETNNSRSHFWILPLVVEDSSHRIYSVEEGLKAFLKGEKVSEVQMDGHCCSNKQAVYLECEITQHPDILTLLLKRYSFDHERRCYVKLHVKVDVPQTLNTENCEYELYALVHHFGALAGGHYTAQIKSFETQAWYNFNDDTVTGIKPPLFGAEAKSVKSATAHLLMYRKVRGKCEKTHDDNLEASFPHSDVEADRKQNETGREEALGLHPPLTISPLIQPLNYLDANSEEHICTWNFREQPVKNSQTKHERIKEKAIINTKETKSGREKRSQRREADGENLSDVKSSPLSINGGSSSSAPSWSRWCENQVSTNEQFGGNLNRKSNILKSNKVKKQCDRNCRLDTVKRNATKSTVKVKRQPWRC